MKLRLVAAGGLPGDTTLVLFFYPYSQKLRPMPEGRIPNKLDFNKNIQTDKRHNPVQYQIFSL